ncbi:hypothetical protein [Nonomuraea deserti]|uniref:hypothetical protein n=1 Tax=Nonomuraea deserti TaxID=1848322 RepID=UPI0014043067|nr:hypothetical protein [Nonomuraea deserti]
MGGASSVSSRCLRPRLTGLGPAEGPEALPTMVYGAHRRPGDRRRYVAPILISMG